MTRVRTNKEAAAHFKAEDSGTCLTENAIRTLVRTGKVPHLQVGRKYLVSIEALENYLNTPAQSESIRLPEEKTVWHIS